MNRTDPDVAAGNRSVTALLEVVVTALGGSRREGQIRMAHAVAAAFESGEHLVVQAGTGTGKSLAYLVPAVAQAVSDNTPVIVSTATLALQRQLIDRDLPRIADALTDALASRPRFVLLKGRQHYLCLNKIHGGQGDAAGAGDNPDAGGLDGLFEIEESRARSAFGRDVRRLTAWAEKTDTGDRDDLRPGVSDRSWTQVSVSARECLGASRCPFAGQCFSERARAAAGEADIVVTNHALLAIDAMGVAAVLPEHRLLVIDEAHDLVDRVTAVATGALTPAGVTATVRRAERLVSAELIARLREAATRFSAAVGEHGTAASGRIDRLDESFAADLAVLRDAAAAVREAVNPASTDARAAAARREALVALDEITDTAGRVLTSFTAPIPDRTDVVWLAHENIGGSMQPALRVAPLSVAGLLRDRLFGRATTVLTSATLAVGGSFDAMAASWGLRGGDSAELKGPDWTALDVGSPFRHAKAGILYVAKHLPPPGRQGTGSAEQLDEIAELITAAGGRTLGLFSSMRAARSATEAMRDRLDTPVLCQGDETIGVLLEQFSVDLAASLFGTLSLWQGVDVPGPSLSLVLIDRIPFPRPDDPLLSSRQRAVSAHGGNGFMAVAATHAALLLAQGAGRLLRSIDDRGVVAILDPRMVTARYSGYLRSSLPPFWSTTDSGQVREALHRLRSE